MSPLSEIDKEWVLRENSLNFFSRISLSAHSELMRVFDSIEKTTVVLEDLVIDMINGKQIDNVQYQQIADEISKRTAAGKEVLEIIDKFVRKTDDKGSKFNIIQLVTNLVTLIRGQDAFDRVKLVTNLPDRPLYIYNNQFLVQQALFSLLQNTLIISQDGDEITITVNTYDSGVVLLIESGSAASNKKLDLAYLELLMEKIGGVFDVDKDSERTVLKLAIPG